MKKKLTINTAFSLLLVWLLSATTTAQSFDFSSDISVVGTDVRIKKIDALNTEKSLPSSIQDGDLILVILGQSDALDLTIDNTSGWTEKDFSISYVDENDINVQVWYKVYQSGDPNKVRFTGSKNNLVYMTTLRGVDANNPFVDVWGHQYTYPTTKCPDNGTKGEAETSTVNTVDKGVHFVATVSDDPHLLQAYSDGSFTNEVMQRRYRLATGADGMMVEAEATNGSTTSKRYIRQYNGDCKPGNGEDVTIAFALNPSSSPVSIQIDDCEDVDATWSSAHDNSLSNEAFNTSSKHVEGSRSIRSRGTKTDDFRKNFDTPVDANGNNALTFWYYINNKTNMGADDQVELGSGGGADVEEYNWELSRGDLVINKWMKITLCFDDASITGGTPDDTQLDWFRLYRVKTGEITSRIDDIRLEYVDPNSKSARTTITNSTDKQPIAIETVENFTLFPNPAKGQVKLMLNDIEDPVTIVIYDMQGRIVLQEQSNQLITIFDVSQLENGVYMVNMTNKEGHKTVKLMVNN